MFYFNTFAPIIINEQEHLKCVTYKYNCNSQQFKKDTN